MAFYFRFTSNIQSDIREGGSYDVFGGKKLDGLCAFSLHAYDEAEARQILAERVGEYAKNYPYYADCGQYVLLEGEYLGNNRDGVLIRPDRVVATYYL